MKKLSIIFTALFAVSLLLVSWNKANKFDNSAWILDGFGCGVYDGDGNLVLADASHTVITHSGNSTLKCYATGVANSTGKAVKWGTGSPGKGCNTYAGPSTKWMDVIDDLGNATLTCFVH